MATYGEAQDESYKCPQEVWAPLCPTVSIMIYIFNLSKYLSIYSTDLSSKVEKMCVEMNIPHQLHLLHILLHFK